MAYSLYLIRNTRDTDLYYAEHGEIGGVPDAVGYDEPLHAMKFRTYEEAQAYIDTSSRSGQETAIVRRSLPPRILPGSAVELRLCSAADPGPPAGADARPASSLEMLKEEKQMSQTPRNKMLTRMEEVRAQVAERDELIEIIAIALLTRKNVFILGDTGQAKSAVINLFRAGITGTNQFERLMSKQTDEEALFGRLDLSSLIPGGVPEEVLEKDQHYQELRRKLETELQTGGPNSASQLADLTAEMEQYRKALAELHSGEPRIITKGKLPDSHIVFLDEIFKASDGILNALLTALNERRYTNEGKTIHIPTISFFSASNEIPNFANPEEKILKPLYDRFELKVVTEYVEDRDARLTILKQKQAAQGTAQNPSAVISLAELQAMQDEVLQVRVPDQVNELMDDVLCGLRGKGIHISDRKYFNYAPIAQAKAWLSGRDTVEPSDLTTLCAYLWTAPEERTIIQSTLERMCNDPLKDRLDTILAEAVEGYQEFTDTADAPAARRIGKLRDEFMSLYITLSQMLSNAQSDAEREKINACLEELERYSKEAHASVQYSYVPLRELYDLKAS
jgi:MoxR-like ATPase